MIIRMIKGAACLTEIMGRTTNKMIKGPAHDKNMRTKMTKSSAYVTEMMRRTIKQDLNNDQAMTKMFKQKVNTLLKQTGFCRKSQGIIIFHHLSIIVFCFVLVASSLLFEAPELHHFKSLFIIRLIISF